MNMRQILEEIRISPIRQATKHRIVHAIRTEARREVSLIISQNPEVRVATPSRFLELLSGDRKTFQ